MLQENQLPVDDRLRLHCRDYCAGVFSAAPGTPGAIVAIAAPGTPGAIVALAAPGTPGPPVTQICFTNFLRGKGVPADQLKKNEIALGREVARIAREEYGADFAPPKKTVLCNGQMLNVNSWSSPEHDDIVERAWTVICERTAA